MSEANETIVNSADNDVEVVPEDNGQVISASAEDEPMLPVGWDGKGDFFDDSSWTDGTAAPDDAAAQEGTSATEKQDTDPAEDGDAPTTGETDEPDETGETEDEKTPDEEMAPPSEEPRKLRFKAQVDHSDVDVEVDESELPALYQKAQVADRVQARMKEQTAVVDNAVLLAKGMGYKSADEMLRAAAKNYRDSEIERLVNDPDHPVHPDVAADIIDRRLGFDPLLAEPDRTTETPAPETAQTAPVTPQRDFKGEVAELIAAKPELLGKQLPAEVQVAAAGGKRLIDAYRDYESKQKDAEAARLKKENKILKHNAETASRAPVKGVTGGGATDNEPEDPFVKGFNSEW
jgi:hypothetical protein